MIIFSKLKRFVIGFYFVYFCLFSNKINAASIDLKAYGLTLHTQPLFGTEIETNVFPFKLDNRGIWIFTPGFYFGYDTRQNNRQSGVSLVYNFSLILSCFGDIGIPFGLGMKYRYVKKNGFFIDFQWFCNALIYTREFIVTHILDTPQSPMPTSWAHFGYFMMHDIPDSKYKIILPLPVYFDFVMGYMFNSGSTLGFSIGLAGIQFVSGLSFSFPIDKFFQE